VAEQFLDFPQILSHLVEEDRGRGVAQPMRGDLPTPRALQAQAEGFKSWLVSIAGKVANAATEGGFFGFGGEKVSGAETAAINELASSLGVKA
jgi:hypothetical protein